MCLVFFLIVLFLFMAVLSIATGLLMLLGAVFVAFLVVTLVVRRWRRGRGSGELGAVTRPLLGRGCDADGNPLR